MKFAIAFLVSVACASSSALAANLGDLKPGVYVQDNSNSFCALAIELISEGAGVISGVSNPAFGKVCSRPSSIAFHCAKNNKCYSDLGGHFEILAEGILLDGGKIWRHVSDEIKKPVSFSATGDSGRVVKLPRAYSSYKRGQLAKIYQNDLCKTAALRAQEIVLRQCQEFRSKEDCSITKISAGDFSSFQKGSDSFLYPDLKKYAEVRCEVVAEIEIK
jgi:hypothetical protein